MRQCLKSMLFFGIMVVFANSVKAQERVIEERALDQTTWYIKYQSKETGSAIKEKIMHRLTTQEYLFLKKLELASPAAAYDIKFRTNKQDTVMNLKKGGLTISTKDWTANALRLIETIRAAGKLGDRAVAAETLFATQKGSNCDSLMLLQIRDLKLQLDNGGNGFRNGNNNGGDTNCCDRTETTVVNSNPTRADLYYEAERTESTIKIRTNMGAEEIAAAAPTFKKLAPCETCGDGSDDLTDTDDAETQTSDDERLFSPTFGVSVLPWRETALANAGLRFNLTNKLSVNGGLMGGYNRIKQSTTILPNGDVSVTTGSHTFVGGMVGANYQLTRKFIAFSTFSAWGVNSDDFSFAVGGLYRIKKTLDVGLALNLGKEVTGVSLNFQF